ncbi:MAG TPA: histidine kinase [Chitinophagaceae bacterium]|nr:histidine kinase [Chitinophagaceae bacterium]
MERGLPDDTNSILFFFYNFFFYDLGATLISIGSLYLSLFLVSRFVKKITPGYQYLLMLFISIPVFCFTYLYFWIGWLYFSGMRKEITNWAQMFNSLTSTHFPISIIAISLLYHNRLQKNALQISQMQNALTETQLKNLQKQVDPQFLFNSLNILAALIKQDEEKSLVFTQKLSEIYRFFLATQKEPFISLKDELKIVDDYFYLISARFGQAFKLNVETEPDLETSKLYIIPGTLQSLIENVVKHNIADEKSPIEIDIIIQNDSLKVLNKIARKESPNSGLGLSNLETRYLLLEKKAVRYGEKEGFFFVEIPLIKNIV